jgi:hypothetical protein
LRPLYGYSVGLVIKTVFVLKTKSHSDIETALIDPVNQTVGVSEQCELKLTRVLWKALPKKFKTAKE